MISRDRITIDSTAAGTRVTCDADLALKGPFRIADPLLGLAFTRVGYPVLRTLAPPPPQALSQLPGRALDGQAYELPGDLAKQHNLVVVAFRRGHQRLVDQWLPWLIDLEQRRSDVALYEVPLLSSVYGPARWFIDGGMTRDTPDASARARTITSTPTSGRSLTSSGLPAPTRSRSCSSSAPAGYSPARRLGFDEQKADRLASALATTLSRTTASVT